MHKQKETKRVIYLCIRYLALILLALGGLWVFYFIFTPLTIYPVFWILNLFFQTSLSGITITFNNIPIQLITACIAGAAYYLLLILNLSTPMPVKTRIKAISFSFILFLAINIIRIVVFSLLLSSSFSLFNAIHLIFWYFLSSLLVFLVWYLEIKLFKIKNIPVYTDLKFIYKLAK